MRGAPLFIVGPGGSQVSPRDEATVRDAQPPTPVTSVEPAPTCGAPDELVSVV